jgi:deoxyhypusine synthase
MPPTVSDAPVRRFIERHFRHFNAAALVDAARDYEAHLARGGKMLITLGGAMSTAELGLSLAEMIRQDKVHAISCTGANLEEDLFNLVAHDHYKRVRDYRTLKPEEEQRLLEHKFNRVTDTCIPEEEAMRRIERRLSQDWIAADRAGARFLPHEFLYEAIRNGTFEQFYQIDPNDSWLVAAARQDLPIFVPGWEDSSLGNVFAARVLRGEVQNTTTIKGGLDYMVELAGWYERTVRHASIGFFQIGGGIAGDFPICVVPMWTQDVRKDIPMWGYFCQISDSTTSYGSYSGAVPNEKITWGKLGPETPKHIIESDATIVAPLLFAYVLGW